LLAYNGAGRLVVHVEVPRRVPELLAGFLDRAPVPREDRPGEPVRRAAVDELERLRPLAFRVDVGGHDRPEELVAEETEVRVVGLDHGRLDEVPLRIVRAAADDDARGVPFCLRDRSLLRLEGAAV